MRFLLSCRLLAGCLLLSLVLGLVSPVHAQETEVVDEIVAIVADDIILRSDVDGYVFGLMQQQQFEYSDTLWLQALDDMINQQVLAIHAQRDTTIIVSDEDVEQALNQRISQITQQVGSTAEIERIYGKSLAQIREDLREEFRDRLLAQQFQSRKVQQVNITPSEVERWFNQIPNDSLPTLPEAVRVAHIVRYPKVSPEAKQDALDIISAIRDSIATGNNTLEEMARRFSDDPGSAASGGHYEDMSLGDLVPEFAAIASRQEIGQLSEPFESPFGYHILRVDERRGETVDFTHILISVDQSQADPTEAINTLTALRDSIVTHNVPFERIARRHSEEEFSASRGGRLIDPSTGQRDLFLEALGPSWQATIDTMEVGEISQPARAELLNGDEAYHIVLLQRRVPTHRVDIETDYTRIEELALQNKIQQELQQWIGRLREDVYIDLRGKAARLSQHLAGEPVGQAESLSQQRN